MEKIERRRGFFIESCEPCDLENVIISLGPCASSVKFLPVVQKIECIQGVFMELYDPEN